MSEIPDQEISLEEDGRLLKAVSYSQQDTPMGTFDMSLPAFSKHLRVLQRAGLLSQDRQGRVRLCQLRPAPLRAAGEWIERYRRFWTRQLDALAEYLDEMEEDSPGESHSRKPQARKRRKQT